MLDVKLLLPFLLSVAANFYKYQALGKWHQGQLPKYLPMRRGFDVFHGLPYSVDDGIPNASTCGDTEETPYTTRGLKLGPEISLPLIYQSKSDNKSVIEEQPVDLTLLSSKMMSTFKDFTSSEVNKNPVFVYYASPHVHT